MKHAQRIEEERLQLSHAKLVDDCYQKMKKDAQNETLRDEFIKVQKWFSDNHKRPWHEVLKTKERNIAYVGNRT